MGKTFPTIYNVGQPKYCIFKIYFYYSSRLCAPDCPACAGDTTSAHWQNVGDATTMANVTKILFATLYRARSLSHNCVSEQQSAVDVSLCN